MGIFGNKKAVAETEASPSTSFRLFKPKCVRIPVASEVYYDVGFNRTFWTKEFKEWLESLKVSWEYQFDEQKLLIRSKSSATTAKAEDAIRLRLSACSPAQRERSSVIKNSIIERPLSAPPTRQSPIPTVKQSADSGYSSESSPSPKSSTQPVIRNRAIRQSMIAPQPPVVVSCVPANVTGQYSRKVVPNVSRMNVTVTSAEPTSRPKIKKETRQCAPDTREEPNYDQHGLGALSPLTVLPTFKFSDEWKVHLPGSIKTESPVSEEESRPRSSTMFTFGNVTPPPSERIVKPVVAPVPVKTPTQIKRQTLMDIVDNKFVNESVTFTSTGQVVKASPQTTTNKYTPPAAEDLSLLTSVRVPAHNPRKVVGGVDSVAKAVSRSRQMETDGAVMESGTRLRTSSAPMSPVTQVKERKIAAVKKQQVKPTRKEFFTSSTLADMQEQAQLKLSQNAEVWKQQESQQQRDFALKQKEKLRKKNNRKSRFIPGSV